METTTYTQVTRGSIHGRAQYFNCFLFYTLQDSPTKFIRMHTTLPRAALEKAEEVIHMYMGLMTQSDKPVDWNCEEEFTEDYPESSTEPLSQTEGIITVKSSKII